MNVWEQLTGRTLYLPKLKIQDFLVCHEGFSNKSRSRLREGINEYSLELRQNVGINAKLL